MSIYGGEEWTCDLMPNSPQIDLKKILQSRTPDSFNSLPQNEYLPTLAAAFLLDRKAQNLTKKTLDFYRMNLQKFIEWCDTQTVKTVTELSPDLLRGFFIAMSERGHNAGGIRALYRTIRVFVRWYALEFEPTEWRDPLRKVKMPKADEDPLEPVPLETIRAMIDTCTRGQFTGERDRAILLFLLDTGVRAGELLALDKQDADILTGDILIRKSKSRKPRTVFVGRTARRALRAYLKLREEVVTLDLADYDNESGRLVVRGKGNKERTAWLTGGAARALTDWLGVRGDNPGALFIAVNKSGRMASYKNMTPKTIYKMLAKRATEAGVKSFSPHDMRRTFVSDLLDAGADITTVSKMAGHSSVTTTSRYDRRPEEAKCKAASLLHVPYAGRGA